MKVTLLLALNIASTIALPTQGCNPNGCLMDLLGNGSPHILTASSDCSSFVDATAFTQTVPTQYVFISAVYADRWQNYDRDHGSHNSSARNAHGEPDNFERDVLHR